MTENTAATCARLFVLQRHIEPTGVSGVGPVAEGVEWSDGTVSLRWKGRTPSTTFWQAGVAAIEAVRQPAHSRRSGRAEHPESAPAPPHHPLLSTAT